MDCQFSFGPNNSYFLKSDSRWAWSDHNTLPHPLLRVLEDPNDPNYYEADYLGQHDVKLAFHRRPASAAKCAQDEYHEPPEAQAPSASGTRILRCVVRRLNPFPQPTGNVLHAATAIGKSITCIALSPYFAGHYFVAFSDGSAQRNLPQEMHTDVKDVVGSPRPFPAAAPAQTLLGATLKYQLAVHTGMALNRMFRTCWS
ncbi:hypothetical protein C8F04DRAFT_1296271 [Mycena alexandri]|uniref:Uncharacterized protein n=1 Tax=Mycena alexandri TaxID=1745969 RepID=A0AAD6WX85_9AGAR|nr:hypothetical protein C8F04DRAFT_1296271 [Mycena alexandri]